MFLLSAAMLYHNNLLTEKADLGKMWKYVMFYQVIQYHRTTNIFVAEHLAFEHVWLH